jgi:endonuclease III
VRDLQALLDLLEQVSGPPEPIPSADGWELVLAENIGYLVDDGQRRRAFPGIGAPGVERIELFSGARAVLALDANALRVLTRLGYGDARRSYSASYRQAQSGASAELPTSVRAMQRATQLLRRHGQTTCRRTSPACATCAIASHCPSAGHATTLY